MASAAARRTAGNPVATMGRFATREYGRPPGEEIHRDPGHLWADVMFEPSAVEDDRLGDERDHRADAEKDEWLWPAPSASR